MHVDRAHPRHSQQRLSQNAAPGEHHQVGRPCSKLCNRSPRILVAACHDRKAVGCRNFPQIAKCFSLARKQRRQVGIAQSALRFAPSRNHFGPRVANDLAHSPLPQLAQQSSAIRRRQRQRASGNIPRLRQPHRHRARGFAVHARTENYDAHEAPSNSRFRRCSIIRASATNLFPQLM